jgi:hypothetical protein
LQKEQRIAKRIAHDLVSITTVEDREEDLGLTDLLRKAIFNLTAISLGSRNSNNNSSSMMMMSM